MCLYMNTRTNAIPDFKSGTLPKPLILDMYGKKFMLPICCHQAEMKTGFIYSQGSKLMFELIKYIATGADNIFFIFRGLPRLSIIFS